VRTQKKREAMMVVAFRLECKKQIATKPHRITAACSGNVLDMPLWLNLL
jgi:hypothetical protein